MNSLKNVIKDYPNFPIEGILFKDLLPVLQHPDIFKNLIKVMSKNKMFKESDAIIAIDSRGFIFGTAISLELEKPMLVARKPGKLPGELLTKSYELEYGTNSLSIQKDSIKNYNSFVIVDDLLATGGTVSCVSEILNKANKAIKGLSVVAELKNLNGRSKFSFPVSSQILF